MTWRNRDRKAIERRLVRAYFLSEREADIALRHQTLVNASNPQSVYKAMLAATLNMTVDSDDVEHITNVLLPNLEEHQVLQATRALVDYEHESKRGKQQDHFDVGDQCFESSHPLRSLISYAERQFRFRKESSELGRILTSYVRETAVKYVNGEITRQTHDGPLNVAVAQRLAYQDAAAIVRLTSRNL